jgi:hypothetical protein
MFKRALLPRISHYMFQLLIKPSSGVSIIEWTDPLLKSLELICITDGHYENQYTDIVYVKDKNNNPVIKYYFVFLA